MVDEVDLGREFFALLEQHDEREVRRVAEEGCPKCDGPLHRGDYDRKPRGALIAPAGVALMVRFSLCCGREGCRKRSTPPSLRFLGRRVYLGAVVIVASVVARALGVSAESRRATGVPVRTMQRWLGWWQGPFVSTEVFVAVCARLVGVAVDELPTSIVSRLPGSPLEQVRVMLELLAPLTTGQGARGVTLSEGARRRAP
jgi:hypothetical protein